MRFLHVTLFSLIASSCHFTAFSAELEPVEVSVYARFYYPQDPVRPTTRRSIEIMREDPGIRIVQWSGLLLPFGGSGYRRSASRSAILMSIAGKSAPDIIETFVGGIRNDVRQGLLHPLNEWIGEDLDGNGLIDDDECEWEAWKAIDPLIRRVVTVDGKVYGIPQAYTHYAAVIFRTDLIRAAGLDSNEPPKTWDELMQIRTSPTKGIDYEFPPDQTVFLTPDGEDLSSVQSTWRANFASPEGIAAAEFFHRLRWMKWIKDPETGEPIELSPDDVEEGQTSVDGRMVAFEEDNLIQGVARAETGQRHNGKWELLGRGEVAMLTWSGRERSTNGTKSGRSSPASPTTACWTPNSSEGCAPAWRASSNPWI
jgi:ABC-type glycerol-3-phosphate transport system substrate-binding protein